LAALVVPGAEVNMKELATRAAARATVKSLRICCLLYFMGLSLLNRED
jgi:hypothetical protein